jgi:hypothetical protein
MLRVILEIVPFPTPQISTFQPAYYLSTALSIAHPNSYTHTLIFTTRPPSSPQYSYQLHTLHYPSAKIVETIRTIMSNFPLQCSPPRAQVQLNLFSFHYTDSQDTRNICYKYGLYFEYPNLTNKNAVRYFPFPQTPFHTLTSKRV